MTYKRKNHEFNAHLIAIADRQRINISKKKSATWKTIAPIVLAVTILTCVAFYSLPAAIVITLLVVGLDSGN